MSNAFFKGLVKINSVSLNQHFEITTGEKAKLISITLGNLKHKGVYSKIKRVQHVM